MPSSTPPLILSTWTFGRIANAAAWPILSNNISTTSSALDAVEAACRAVEEDDSVDSVGRGGLPDSSGSVSLDACIMLAPNRAAGVAGVRRFLHVASIARRVMEKTPHVLLVGEGAESFAESEGFTPAASLLTEKSRADFKRWSADPAQLNDPRFRGWLPPLGRSVHPQLATTTSSSAAPAQLARNDNTSDPAPHNKYHDTIGVLAIDSHGTLAGACSTSGMAFKLPGRVGDSPIIGHGLYVDPAVGAAVATGTGELIMGVSGSFLAVESLRRGASPIDACLTVLHRIASNFDIQPNHQAALIALRPDGSWASASLRPGYVTAIRTTTRDDLVPADLALIDDSSLTPTTSPLNTAR